MYALCNAKGISNLGNKGKSSTVDKVIKGTSFKKILDKNYYIIPHCMPTLLKELRIKLIDSKGFIIINTK